MASTTRLTLDELAETIASRRSASSDTSYTAGLLQAGLPRAAQKLGEEATETVIAAVSGNSGALCSEAADLLFHLLVVLELGDVPLEDVYGELGRRSGTSGLEEKAGRLAD